MKCMVVFNPLSCCRAGKRAAEKFKFGVVSLFKVPFPGIPNFLQKTKPLMFTFGKQALGDATLSRYPFTLGTVLRTFCAFAAICVLRLFCSFRSHLSPHYTRQIQQHRQNLIKYSTSNECKKLLWSKKDSEKHIKITIRDIVCCKS